MSTGSTTNCPSQCSSLPRLFRQWVKSLVSLSIVWPKGWIRTFSRHIAGLREPTLCRTTLPKCLPTPESHHTVLHSTLNTSRVHTTTTFLQRKEKSTTRITNEWASFSSSKQPSIPSRGLISVDLISLFQSYYINVIVSLQISLFIISGECGSTACHNKGTFGISQRLEKSRCWLGALRSRSWMKQPGLSRLIYYVDVISICDRHQNNQTELATITYFWNSLLDKEPSEVL